VLPAVATDLALSPGAGALYDPYDRATASGRPRLALDGNRGTAWFAEVAGATPAATTPGTSTTPTTAATAPASTTPATTTATTTPALAQGTATDDDPVKPGQLGVGYTLDLGREHILNTLTISTPAPGFGVQIYGTDAASAPPDLLDSRWERLAGRPKVGATTKIRLDRAGFTYRTLMVWVTTPAPRSQRVQISELKVRAR
jgi:hypothetical protein